MKNLLIIGGDYLGNIEKKLNEIGFRQLDHVKGRKEQGSRLHISQKADAVLILLDYVNHNLARETKMKAKERSIPVFYAKRSWTSIQQSIKQSGAMVAGE